MAGTKNFLKKMLFYSEPKQRRRFALLENQFDKSRADGKNESQSEQGKTEESKDTLPDEKRKKNEGILYNKQSKEKENKEREKEYQHNEEPGPSIVPDLKQSLEYMKQKYSIPVNGDMILREFSIAIGNKTVDAFIMFFDGLVDRETINEDILKPLMVLSSMEIKTDEKDIIHYIRRHLLPQNQLTITNKYIKVIDEINFGGCGLFIEGCRYAFAADVKGWEHRAVERPNMELVIRGPQESFNEVLRANTALVRKILKDEDLIAEDVSIGKRSKTACSFLYIKDVANDSLVQEVRRRLNSISVDYLIDSGELEQYLEDQTYIPSPQVIATERPDRVASALTEGKVAVIMNNSSYAIIMPVTIPSMIHSSEDSYVRFPYANFFKFVRLIGIAAALFLPAIYIAVTNYHHEMIPTDLLLAIEASRETVPFPSVVEILIMEFSFELIREAGIRVPGPIGPTLGIIGALILGQAAVAANIVSPILIIIVAVTGIGSFVVPNYSLAFSFRILRFGFIILAGLAGFLGLTAGIFVYLLQLCEAKSFGVPLMTPLGPVTSGVCNGQITRSPIWKQERRPDYLSPKDEVKQEKISRKWSEEDPEENT